MQQQTTETARFMQALDEQQPLWWREFAEPQELQDYIDQLISNAHNRGREKLRAHVANRLLVAVRAALSAGIVELPSATVTTATDDYKRGYDAGVRDQESRYLNRNHDMGQ